MFLPVIRQLLGYIRGYKRLLAFFVQTLLLDLAFVSLAPLSFQFMIDRAVIPRDMGAFALILTGLALSGIVCLGAGVASDYALARIAALTQRDLRRRLFVRLQGASMGYLQRSANMGYLLRSRSGELLWPLLLRPCLNICMKKHTKSASRRCLLEFCMKNHTDSASRRCLA